jgi:hypothetical protein
MPGKRSQPARRKPRTDAQQNRGRILEVAKDAFTRRDALLEAVYRTEVAKLAAAARDFAAAMPPPGSVASLQAVVR